MLLDAIRARCKAQGITIAELEDRAGLKKGVIWRWNDMNPNLNNLVIVADALGVTVDELIKEVTKREDGDSVRRSIPDSR